jgi:beta-lactam-binding protein with PASTA domain
MSQAQSLTATFVGKPVCVVPKVKGKKLRAAKRALVRAHCRPGKVTRRYSRIRRGRVISQRPRPGKHLKPGAKVRLVVSKGKKP